MKHSQFETFAQLRATFPNADLVGRLVVFNIGGNNWRLIAAIHYNSHKLFIRDILTHDEYELGEWKDA